jgi:hypothetical protein
VPNKKFKLSSTFGNKNNNILQLGTILNNEAGVLESFFQIFGIEGKCFQNFQKENYQCLASLGTVLVTNF